MTPPGCSVVLPTRDTRELTRACLLSLQPFGADEVIAVDDGSRDGTRERLSAEFPGLRWLRNEEPAGFAPAANQGLAAAGGEVLLLLNSDTQVLAGSARDLLAHFGTDPRLGALGASLRNPDGSPQWSGGALPTLLWFLALGAGVPGALRRSPLARWFRPPSGSRGGPVDWLPATALALRREAWLECGPFSSRYATYAQDLELSSTLRKRGWHLRVDPRFVVLHHLGGTLGGSPGSVRGQRLESLWTDLLLWARQEKGPSWSALARHALLLGARLRLGFLWLLARRGGGGGPSFAEFQAVRKATAALRDPRGHRRPSA